MADLLFDIGGTRTRLAKALDGGGFTDPVFVETPQKFDEGIKVLSESAKKICGEKIHRAVGGIAGSLTRERDGVYRAPNLLDWEQKNFVEALSNSLAANVTIQNDTAIVGLGEAVSGAGRNYNIVVYITISTGVNGAKITEKKIDENVFGFEIGHQIIDVVTHLDKTNARGELEDFISGRETERRLGVPPKDIIDPKEWRKIAEWTAVGIYNSVVHWSPDVVVLGGAMMRDISIEIVKDKLRTMIAEIYPESPEIVKAELGAIGGIYGANYYLANPS